MSRLQFHLGEARSIHMECDEVIAIAIDTHDGFDSLSSHEWARLREILRLKKQVRFNKELEGVKKDVIKEVSRELALDSDYEVVRQEIVERNSTILQQVFRLAQKQKLREEAMQALRLAYEARLFKFLEEELHKKLETEMYDELMFVELMH